MSFIRELANRLGTAHFEDVSNGDLMVYAVPALMEGNWTDSLAQTPLYYTKEALESYATNWTDNGLWARHTGGQPRAVTEKIGEVLNPRYKMLGDKGALLVDIRIFGATTRGRDAKELVKAGLINYVSVEHGGEEVYNPARKSLESKTLVFSGLALVSKGACQTCTIAAATDAALKEREASCVVSQNSDFTTTSLEVGEKEMADNSMDQMAALQKQMAEMMAQINAQKAALEAQAKAQAEAAVRAQLDAATAAQKAAEAKAAESQSLLAAKTAEIDRLNKTPLPPATTVTPAAEPKAQVSAEPLVRWDKRKGIIEANN